MSHTTSAAQILAFIAFPNCARIQRMFAKEIKKQARSSKKSKDAFCENIRVVIETFILKGAFLLFWVDCLFTDCLGNNFYLSLSVH
jgi:hypothetical protein